MKPLLTAVFLLCLSFQYATAQAAGIGKWQRIVAHDPMTDAASVSYILPGTNASGKSTPELHVSCNSMYYDVGRPIIASHFYSDAYGGSDASAEVSYRGDAPRPTTENLSLTSDLTSFALNSKVFRFMMAQHQMVFEFVTANGSAEISTFDVSNFPGLLYSLDCRAHK